MSKKFYAVLRLHKELKGQDVFGNETTNVLEKGQYFIPVFDTEEAALDYGLDGKYEVITIATVEP